jgi:CelD/BcsL family acetyltransferase involved in cellulose biosynthesis
MWVVGRCDDFDFRSDEYAELYDRSAASLFQHPVWLEALYADLAPRLKAQPVVVTVRSELNGELAAVLPLVRRRGLVRRVEFADLGVSDYAAPVIDRAVAGNLTESAEVTDAVRRAIGRADLVRLDKIRGDAAGVASLIGARSVVQHGYDAHAIPLPGSFETWRAARDPDFVRHIDGKRKRVGRKRRVLGLRELDQPDEIDAAFEQMREFRLARFADRRAVDLFQDPRYFEFYRRVAHQSAREGGPGSTVVLTINDETVGVSFGMSDAERDLFVLIGYDYEQYRNYSLGLIFVEELIAVSIAHGKQLHDLTLGHDSYKSDFGAVPTPMYSTRRPLTVRGRLGQLAADQNTAARRVAKSVLAHREQRPARFAALGERMRARRAPGANLRMR